MSPRPHIAAVTSTQAAPTPMSAAETLDRVAWLWQALADAESVSGTAARVVELVRALTGADACGLLVRDDQGQTSRLAERGPVPEGAGLLGAHDPVTQPLADGGLLAIDDTHADVAWPSWSAAAADRGVLSARFVGLPALHDRPVTLELYAHRAHAFDGSAAQVVAAAARHAGIALHQAQRVADLEQDAHTRALVGQASGILMERYHLTADQSMSYLVRSSERARLALRELAWELVAAQDRAAVRTRAPHGEEGATRPPE